MLGFKIVTNDQTLTVEFKMFEAIYPRFFKASLHTQMEFDKLLLLN